MKRSTANMTIQWLIIFPAIFGKHLHQALHPNPIQKEKYISQTEIFNSQQTDIELNDWININRFNFFAMVFEKENKNDEANIVLHATFFLAEA
jgi:hypothetical protein